MHPKFQWYALRTFVKREEAVRDLLFAECGSENIADIFIPVSPVNTLGASSNKKIKMQKYMPGYMFLKIENKKILFSKIEKMRNVIGFLGDPTPLEEEEVLKMMSCKDDGLQMNKTHSFYVGMNVDIIEGPFEGFKGSIATIHEEKHSCIVDVYILGRSTPVELNFSQVEQEI